MELEAFSVAELIPAQLQQAIINLSRQFRLCHQRVHGILQCYKTTMTRGELYRLALAIGVAPYYLYH